MSLSTFSQFKRFRLPGSVELNGARLRRLQTVEFEIAKDVFAFCRENGIVCMLAGGSALGALRHGGFIPWDDDMDLLMPRADYERFRRGFSGSFDDRYCLRDAALSADHVLGSVQVRRKGTSVITREDLVTGNRDHGAFVDIFIIENTFDNVVLRGLHGFGSLLIGFLYSCRKSFSERWLLKAYGTSPMGFRRTLRAKSFVGFFLSFTSVNRWVRLWNGWNSICRRLRSNYVTVPVGRAHFFGELGRREELCETRGLVFEGLEFCCPKGLEAYLTRLYGPDYMTPPQEQDRESHMVFEPFRLSNEEVPFQRTTAVIVTFNRPDFLKTCLTALRNQSVPCDLVLVDNGKGADATARDSGFADFVYLPMQTNVGGAGGFSIGVQKAVSLGYDRIWIIDDDAEPTTSALERLQRIDRRLGGDFGWLSSKCVTEAGRLVPINIQRRTPYAKLRFAGRSLVRAEMASFVSLYVPAAVIREVGLPIAEFFIWCDDLEYTRRISVVRPCYAVSDSRVIHDGGRSHVPSVAMDSADRIPRYYYAFRNEFFTYRREGPRGILYFTTKVMWHELKILLHPDRLFFVRQSALWRGIFAGFLFHPEVKPCR